jgi:predicted alpha/beta hydrolase family esterase
MTHPQNQTHSGRHLQDALDHATRLSQPGPSRPVTPSWSAQADHVGDMSVLLLALRS